MLSERPTREASHENAEHGERVVVAPALSGLEGERELGQPGEPLVGAERDGIWPGLRAVVGHRLLQRRITELHAVAGTHGQQVAKGDRAVGRDGIVQRRGRTGQHPSVGELRQPLLETLVEPETTRLHQTQSRDRRDRLGHRLDPHDGVVTHGIPVNRGDAGGNHFGVAAPAQCYGTRHGTGLDMADQKPFELSLHGVTRRRCRKLPDRSVDTSGS